MIIISHRMAGCPLDCSGHGTCDRSSQKCQCYEEWKGDGCNVPVCPGNTCGPHGTCSMSSHRKGCNCNHRYRGMDTAHVTLLQPNLLYFSKHLSLFLVLNLARKFGNDIKKCRTRNILQSCKICTIGADCSIPDSKGVWYDIEPSHPPLGRASHKSAVDDEYMYVLKGETFSDTTSKIAR